MKSVYAYLTEKSLMGFPIKERYTLEEIEKVLNMSIKISKIPDGEVYDNMVPMRLGKFLEIFYNDNHILPMRVLEDYIDKSIVHGSLDYKFQKQELEKMITDEKSLSLLNDYYDEASNEAFIQVGLDIIKEKIKKSEWAYLVTSKRPSEPFVNIMLSYEDIMKIMENGSPKDTKISIELTEEEMSKENLLKHSFIKRVEENLDLYQ